MLDTNTKRRIDTARNILVGKVPDPKSQVEQITIALIYKFMDDMDAESEEFGGKRKFFAKKFAQYGWGKLMRSGLGGHEMLSLYAEAIGKMPENPGIPPLFRDIFKNAYLPYRDPETLRAFLKIIDEFNYDHSERLGDAFEYLLSVLGSQGDAGQFRTPRHIIDFIVEVLDPKKNETVLDPACGTSGFLISAYKHILKANTDKKGNSKLTPDDKAKLAQNFKGYDISPDMVRLSLVNMYLHGFTDPHIYEYDTLTSQDRWNEYVDVILANPPFMSPKGGIKPHNRFSVQSKRSEVLFVDYMAEHLTPNGRAGIIVPEGIIFQSQTAYKQLRKMLVEEYLVAVVSLPAGIFQPYSGVKTSILILDKSLAKKSNAIAFFKVENDGFGLGAQRRAIAGEQLTEVKAELDTYLQVLRHQQPTADLKPTRGLIVPKEKMAANGDYNLSVERYREGSESSAQFPWVELGTITIEKPQYGSGASKVVYDGVVRYIRITDLTEQGKLKETNPVSPSIIEEYCFLQYGDLLIARSGSVGRTYLHEKTSGSFQFAGYLIRFRVDPAKAIPAFVFQITQSPYWDKWIAQQSKTGTISNINAQEYSSFRFPMPPLEVQKQIVAEIEGYQKVIDGARAVIDNYRPHIPIHPDWPRVALSEVAEVTSSKRILAEEYVPLGTPFYRTKEIVELGKGHNISIELYISQERFDSIKDRFGAPAKGELLISAVGTIGVSWVVADDRKFYFKDGNLLWIRNLSNLDPYFLKHCLDSTFAGGIDHIVFGAAYKALTIEKLKDFKIPFPPIAVQRTIVAGIEAEQSLVNANRDLIGRFEKKIQTTLARIWDEQPQSDTKDALSHVVPTKPLLPVLGEVEEKSHFKRIVLATHIINQSMDDTLFGATKLEKLLYLSENSCLKRNFDQHYYKQVAGPYDNKFTRSLMTQLKEKAKWFAIKKKGNQSVFFPGANHEKSKQQYGYFSTNELSRLNNLISYFQGHDYNFAEIVATLHAVWNNRIIRNEPITDAFLVADFYAWHKQKERFDEDTLRRALQWMREKEIVPDGWGRLIEWAKQR